MLHCISAVSSRVQTSTAPLQVCNSKQRARTDRSTLLFPSASSLGTPAAVPENTQSSTPMDHKQKEKGKKDGLPIWAHHYSIDFLDVWQSRRAGSWDCQACLPIAETSLLLLIAQMLVTQLDERPPPPSLCTSSSLFIHSLSSPFPFPFFTPSPLPTSPPPPPTPISISCAVLCCAPLPLLSPSLRPKELRSHLSTSQRERLQLDLVGLYHTLSLQKTNLPISPPNVASTVQAYQDDTHSLYILH